MIYFASEQILILSFDRFAAVWPRHLNDLVIFGSPTLSHYLMQHELIDEYRLTVSPVVLGSGIPLFTGMEQTKLTLLDTRRLRSGVIILHYETNRPYSSIINNEKNRAKEISTTVTRQK
ncbi:dihydrofolate reductase family protein [Paenibacillus spongiae]|uniref:Dihydrofolate reductase family protein n=1 Tax=Paenibacillus spongiae TaxID=2909671 RepID=A0ABY5S263_9BACL|nr:dihydrofolate reductase family protein [Paenibacillus spongiae]UVI27734.1 dihydrofolate reductase family protein [Paenibacillus spongiae]